jgi:NitT/TauT family transport system permease protein
MAADPVAGIHRLEAEPAAPALERRRAGRAWSAVWPKLAAIGLALGLWQVVVWSGWKPDYVLPGPLPVLGRLGEDLRQADFYVGVLVTVRRAVDGYLIAIVIGTAVGLLVARVAVLRKAIGSAILGLQSMPSVVWLPLAIILFAGTEASITFVVVLGAAPAVASGLLSGIDHVQPLFVRVGRVMGARGLSLYRYVILPAALPAFVAGLKQGWAFAWRSLMAGELLAIVAHQPSLGQRLEFARQFSDVQQLLALMIVIFTIGVAFDFLFGLADRRIRLAWGLAGD